MSLADVLRRTSEKIAKVFDAGVKKGKDAEQNAFWNMFEHEKRSIHANAFYGWGAEYIRPLVKLNFTNANDGNSVFAYCRNLKKVEKEHFDFSTKPTGNTSTTGWYYTFYGCTNLEEIEDIGLTPQKNCHYTFYYCEKLHTIAKLGVKEETTFGNTFTRCNALKNIVIDGTIGQNIDFGDCYSLSAESIDSIINALSDTEAGLTCTIYLTNYLVNNWDELVARKPNWRFQSM